MPRPTPSQVQIVIIGGGVMGTALAFHLAELGVTDVALIERGQLGCGTSWHAAGNIPLMDHSPAIIELNYYASNLYESFHQENPIGWRRCGRVMVARTSERLGEFQRLVSNATSVGIEACIISPSEVHEKLPLFRTDDIIGALWSPLDGRVNPTDLIMTYARKARDKDIQILEDTTAGRVNTQNGAVKSVSTNRGDIHCETVVNCCGLWARQLAIDTGISIPIYPVEHFYALTETVEGVTPEMPSFRDPDGLIYGREEVGGLLVGCFDRNAKPIAPSELPDKFYFSLLNEDWEQFGPYMTEGIHRIPSLSNVGIRSLLNGPEGFTPDAHPILSEAPNLKGYFILAGMSSAGILRSAGLSRALANWIVNGDALIDLSPFLLDRFTAQQNNEKWLREHIRHVPSGYLSGEY